MAPGRGLSRLDKVVTNTYAMGPTGGQRRARPWCPVLEPGSESAGGLQATAVSPSEALRGLDY